MKKETYKIGYIDEDIKQVKLYARKLKKFSFKVIGYEFEEEMTKESLMKQVYESDIDLLMIDFKLKDTNIVTFNGETLEKMIYNDKPLFPHIIFTNNKEDAEPVVEDLKIIFDKEIFSEDDERIEKFVKMLEKSIKQYKNYISKKKNVLSNLLEKEVKEGLTAIEKNDLITTQEELKNLDKTRKDEVPKILIHNDTIEALNKTRKEAEEFLQLLIEKGKKK